jgi:hypothetical protein
LWFFHQGSCSLAIEALWWQQKAGSEKYTTMPLLSVSNSCSIEMESRKFAALNNSTFKTVGGSRQS